MEDTQNNAEFEPDSEQLEFAFLYLKHCGNISKASQEFGDAGRNIYYKKWKHQEGFETWLNEFAKKSVLSRFGKWYLLLEKFAEKGSFQHLDRLLEIAKEFTPQTQVFVNVPHHTVIFKDISDDAEITHAEEGPGSDRAKVAL